MTKPDRQFMVTPGLSAKLASDGRLRFEQWRSWLKEHRGLPGIKPDIKSTLPRRVIAVPAKVPQWIADKIAATHPLSGNADANAKRFR